MTNFLSSESNRKYRSCNFDKNGFYIGHLASSEINFNMLRTNIIDSKIFEDMNVSWALFNEGHDAGEIDEGRNQVSVASFKKKQKTDYCHILSTINVISNELVKVCNSDLTYSIDPKNSIPTILETTVQNSEPQLMHVDMGYDNCVYREQLLCLFALEDNTYFRLVRGSHAFQTLQDLENSKKTKKGTFLEAATGHATSEDESDDDDTLLCGGGFMIPTVVTLKQGQFVVMHPKLFHSGWTADGHNIRLHFYFGLKQIKLSSNRKIQKQAETYIMEAQLAKLFNGEARNKHIKNLKSSSLKKQKDAKVIKAKRFQGKMLINQVWRNSSGRVLMLWHMVV